MKPAEEIALLREIIESCPRCRERYRSRINAASSGQSAENPGENRLQIGAWIWNIRSESIQIDLSTVQLLTGQDKPVSNSITPRRIFEILHPEDIETTVKALSSNMNGQRDHFQIEVRMMDRTGHWRWFIVQGETVERDETGFPSLLSGTLVDITARKEIEARERSMRRLLQKIADSHNNLVVTRDRDGRMQFCNRAFAGLVGREPEQLLGLTEQDLEFKLRPADAPVENDGTTLFEFRHAFRKRLLKANVKLLQDEELEQHHTLFIGRDVTEEERVRGQLQRQYERINVCWQRTLEALSDVIELTNPYMIGHQREVAEISWNIAKQLKLGDEIEEGVFLAGLVHDIGMVYVPSMLLSSPENLSDVELSLVHTHPEVGASLLKGIDFHMEVIEAVRHHHERFDGSGYPDALSGERIPMSARILAVADSLAAMRSSRPHREALQPQQALERLCQGRGVEFDPRIVDAVIQLFNEDKLFQVEASEALPQIKWPKS